MGKRAKPTTIISASLGVAGYLVERGLDMAGITLSLGWAIILWVISGILILFAGFVGFKAYIWPFLRNIRIVRKKRPQSWLEQELASDLQRIHKGMRGRATRWDFSGIYNREPYFDVFVELTNTTIFTFSLKNLSGFMKIAGEPCVNPPQVSTRFGIKRDEPADIRVRQPIAPETVVIIQDAGNSNQEIEFNLGEVIFEIKNTTNGYEQHNPYLTGGNYMIVPRDGLKIDDALKIEVSKCYFAKEQLRPLETLILIIELTVRAASTPIHLASLQLCIGTDKIDPITPMLPVTVVNSPSSYLARYDVAILTLIERSDKNETGHILTFTMGQEWLSDEFQIPYDSPLLPQEVT